MVCLLAKGRLLRARTLLPTPSPGVGVALPISLSVGDGLELVISCSRISLNPPTDVLYTEYSVRDPLFEIMLSSGLLTFPTAP